MLVKELCSKSNLNPGCRQLGEDGLAKGGRPERVRGSEKRDLGQSLEGVKTSRAS